MSIENPIFNFCVGVWVGGHLMVAQEGCTKNSKSFDTDVVTGGDREKGFWMKNRPKNENHVG